MRDSMEYTVIKHLGVLSWEGKYSIEMNIVAWNGYAPKFDLRRWKVDKDGTKTPARGISLTAAEVEVLRDMLKDVESFNGLLYQRKQ